MELLDNAIVCFHTPSRQTVICRCFFAADRNEFPARWLFCILKSSQIYLFDRILATSCFSAKTDTCFKITEFMFQNHKIIQTNDKVEPLLFAKN